MYPYIKPFVEITPFEEGVIFKGKNDYVVINGKLVYKWFMTIKPYLNGKIPFGKITQSLNDDQQAFFNKIINPLIKANYIIDYSTTLSHTLSEREMDLYSEEIGYLDGVVNSPEYSFQQYRKANILIKSEITYLPFLIRALIKTGARKIDYIKSDFENDSFYLTKLNEYIKTHKEYDPAIEVTGKKLGVSTEEYDVVVIIQDLGSHNELQSDFFNHPKVVASFINKNNTYIIPYQDSINWRYDDLISRIQMSGKEHTNNFEDNNDFLTIYVSNSIAYEVFRSVTGIAKQSHNNAIKLNKDTLEQSEVTINNFLESNSFDKSSKITNDRLNNDLTNKSDINAFLEIVENQILNTELPFLEIIEGDSQLPVSNCVIKLITSKFIKHIRKLGINYNVAMFNAIDLALREFAISRLTSEITIENYYIFNKEKWIEFHAKVEVKDIELVSSIGTEQEVFDKCCHSIRLRQLIKNSTRFLYLDKRNINADTLYYVELLQRKYSEPINITYYYSPGTYVVLIKYSSNRSIISYDYGDSLDTTVKNAVINAIEGNNSVNNINTNEDEFSSDNKVFIPFTKDIPEFNNLPYSLGWIASFETLKGGEINGLEI
ncbi:hypothetical protein [Pseudalkalibacillus sp. JSM 102089]|uniref:hypothetical protein n=1 Tax=Pseudalkalibacillus sp. JSM 102089 TaxID=3229856 RepID=UPI003525F937